MTIDLHSLWTVCLVYAAGLLSPGPNFLAIAHYALRGYRLQALATAAGVVTVNGLWASTSLFGVDLLFGLAPWMLALLKGAAAVYLFLVGVRLWRRAGLARPVLPGAAQGGTLAASFRAGAATNLANIKAVAFYAAAFSTVAPTPERMHTLYVALALVLLLACLWYGLVALLLSARSIAVRSERWSKWAERSGGIAMIGFCLALVLDNSLPTS